jgi:hypothetical protein
MPAYGARVTKRQRTYARSARRIADKLARPAVAVVTAGGMAFGIAAPAVMHERHLAEPVFIEAVAEMMPMFIAPAPVFTVPAAEIHGPHAHLPHTELLEYLYIPFTSPIVVTGSGGAATLMTVGPLTRGYSL